MFAFLIVVGAYSSPSWPAQPAAWPQIRPVHVQRTIVDSAGAKGDNPIVVSIEDWNGRPRYRLECHTGDYNDMSLMNFSGVYQCALFALAGSRPMHPNLLAAKTRFEQSTDYTNRARMTAGQLREPCSASPTYGKLRRIRLRGMLVTIAFDPVLNSKRGGGRAFRRLTIDVSVVQDTTARTAEAEPMSPLHLNASGEDPCG